MKPLIFWILFLISCSPCLAETYTPQTHSNLEQILSDSRYKNAAESTFFEELIEKAGQWLWERLPEMPEFDAPDISVEWLESLIAFLSIIWGFLELAAKVLAVSLAVYLVYRIAKILKPHFLAKESQADFVRPVPSTKRRLSLADVKNAQIPLLKLKLLRDLIRQELLSKFKLSGSQTDRELAVRLKETNLEYQALKLHERVIYAGEEILEEEIFRLVNAYGGR